MLPEYQSDGDQELSIFGVVHIRFSTYLHYSALSYTCMQSYERLITIIIPLHGGAIFNDIKGLMNGTALKHEA